MKTILQYSVLVILSFFSLNNLSSQCLEDVQLNIPDNQDEWDITDEPQAIIFAGLPSPSAGTSGSYMGDGVQNITSGIFTFNPVAAGVGVHTITYTFTNVNGCIESATDQITVTQSGTTFTYSGGNQCTNSTQLLLSGGEPLGGVYSGTGVTTDGTNYFFNSAAAGTFTITYTANEESATEDIKVYNVPAFSIPAGQSMFDATDPAELIITGGNLTANASFNGTYTGPGVVNTAGNDFAFDPSMANLGPNTITYTSNIGCGPAATGVITVGVSPTTFTAPADLCINAGVQTGLSGGLPIGGVYSGDGVTDNPESGTYDFDPAEAGSGTITIKYTTPDMAFGDDDVEVIPLPTLNIPSSQSQFCSGDQVATIAFAGTPAGGTYDGSGVMNLDNTGIFNFNPAEAGIGIHTITYTTDCGMATASITVFGPSITFSAPDDLCLNSSVILLTGGVPTGGTYMGNGVSNSGNGTYSFDPTEAGVGVHEITYTVADQNNCTGSVTDMIEVFALPQVSTNSTDETCADADGTATAMGSPMNSYAWSNDGTGISISHLTEGTYTVTATDVRGCTNSAIAMVGNNDIVLQVSASTTPAICTANNGTATAMVGNGMPGYKFIWSNGESGPSIENLAPGGYSVAATDSKGCTGSLAFDVNVGQTMTTLTVTTSAMSSSGMADNGTATAVASGGTADYMYSWSNGDSGSSISDLAPGTYSVTSTDVNGCTGESGVEVLNLSSDDFSYIDPCTCENPKNVIIASDIPNSLFHNIVTVGPINPDLEITLSVNDGNMLDASGTELPIDGSIMMTEVIPGIYELEFYHKHLTMTDYSLMIGGSEFQLSSDICEFDKECLSILGIPTMGQWALFILALLLMNVGLVVMYRQEKQIA